MKRTVLFGFFLAVTGAAVAVVSPHRASAQDHCRDVHARVADAITSEGCASPVGLCTAGTVTGSGLGGALSATVMNIAPGATPGTSSLDAFDQIATDHGTLFLHFTGVFDPIHGAVTFVGEATSGTGRFEGATGRLYVNGGAAADGGFESDLTGQLCFPAGADD